MLYSKTIGRIAIALMVFQCSACEPDEEDLEATNPDNTVSLPTEY